MLESSISPQISMRAKELQKKLEQQQLTDHSSSRSDPKRLQFLIDGMWTSGSKRQIQYEM
jgi:hypothetical protein